MFNCRSEVTDSGWWRVSHRETAHAFDTRAHAVLADIKTLAARASRDMDLLLITHGDFLHGFVKILRDVSHGSDKCLENSLSASLASLHCGLSAQASVTKWTVENLLCFL